jgi:two-component system, NtrC family, sensor kinase
MPGMIVLARSVVQIPDSEEVGLPDHVRQVGRILGFRSVVGVPMLREGEAVGALLVTRREPGRFSDPEVELLKTFSDQAVIAIENVRLFKELEVRNRDLSETLEQQVATADILKVISASPTDVQPVFEMIAARAMSLCGADLCLVQRPDGDQVYLAAIYGADPASVEVARNSFPMPLSTESLACRAMRGQGIVHVADVLSDPTYELKPQARAMGFRSGLAVPMLRDEQVIGAIYVGRAKTGLFSPKQVELLQTFADQAVIAIENVRLFTELQEKNRALTIAHAQVTEALDQQTATSEILSVISSSPTDLQPVFDTITRNAVRLCEAINGHLYRFDGERIHLIADANVSGQAWAEWQQTFPRPLSDGGGVRHVIETGRVLNLADFGDYEGFTPAARTLWVATGIHSALLVPMMLQGKAIGAIVVNHRNVGAFSDAQVELLKTFAAQAVIAIENVRLFKELEARTQDLTRSVGELRALSEVGQAISSTLDLQTVLSTIVVRATNLSGTDAGVIYEFDDQREVFVPRATAHLEAEIVETMLATPVRKGEGATGRLAEVHEPIQVLDVLAAPAESRVRGALVRAGYRALLAVPLVREGHLIGGLTVIRKATGAFAPEIIELLTTFATQSALAIQNARLFREIEDKSHQLEVASQHKSEFLANMSHELRTPLNAIIGFSEVLTDRMFGDLNEKQEEYLKDIYASGTHLLSLINDILDLSKIEAGRMELELSDFDLPTALDNALMLVRERAQRRSLTLHKDVDAGVGQIKGDERKIRQVVLNLLSNAIKFTPEGGRIEVAAVPKDGLVEVSVSDTGVGIAPEDQEKVFEEFRQVGTADKKAEGTGLGLTLCRKFIELHGGRIWVKSQVGVGSTFTFMLPLTFDQRHQTG